MKKKDLVTLHDALIRVEGRQSPIKFSYFVAKNKLLIKEEFEMLQNLRKAPEKFVEYDRKRATLAQEHADRLENGQPKIEDNNFIIIERFEEFREKLEALKEDYADAIADYEKRVQDFEDILEQEYTYNGAKIDYKDIPETIEPAILEAFMTADLIIDSDDE